MAFPVIFATLPTGNNPASLFDTMFSTVGGMGIIECTATGTNTILLTPVANMPTVAAYSALATFSFVAAGANSGAVTVNVSGIGAMPLVSPSGAALTANAITTGQAVLIAYDGTASFYITSGVAAGTSIASVKKQTFVATGTYTPSTGMLFALLLGVGAGGGGGGANGTANNGSGGGGAGQLALVLATAATIGASKAVTIPGTAAGGTTAGTNGATGGDTSVGAVLVAKGGSGGVGTVGGLGAVGGLGGTGGTSDLATTGAPGQTGAGGTANNNFGGAGGSTLFGGGGIGSVNAAGGNATGFGGGGGGASGNASAHAGGTGSGGAVYILEFCSV